VDLREIVCDAIETTVPSNGDRRHVDLALPREAVWLSADPARLRQVFQNLLGNAIKFTAPDDQIAIAVEPSHSEVTVRVHDAGVGIDPAMLTRILDLFTKGDHSNGFGIGLSVVKRLVQQHGGVVEAHSRGRGEGSEFTVRLPLASVATR
jgi:signal transduction histidine kinase